MKMPWVLISGMAAVAALALAVLPTSAETVRRLPAPAADETTDAAAPRIAVFAGGCFWGVQGVFQHVDGVTSAVSGYAGGDEATAQYEKVGRGWTGHAEAVRIIGVLLSPVMPGSAAAIRRRMGAATATPAPASGPIGFGAGMAILAVVAVLIVVAIAGMFLVNPLLAAVSMVTMPIVVWRSVS